MIKEEFVTYSQAKALKECGFDWETYFCYDDEQETCDDKIPYQADAAAKNHNRCKLVNGIEYYSAPTQALAQKWLREVHNIHVLPHLENVNIPQYVCHVTHLRNYSARLTDDAKYFPTCEAALSAGIDAALELIKQK